jgi:threonyl-tRNA synthetase
MSISPRLAAAAVVARIQPITAAPAQPADSAGPEVEGGATPEASMYSAEPASAERLVDLSAPLHEDVSLQLLTEKDGEALKVVRHSAAHVMATAVLELYPETKLGHGPATEAGFFYDFYRPTPFTPEDLKAIEARMAEVVARNEPFVRAWEPREQSLARFQASNDFMKAHFVERFTKPGEEISFYRNGLFEDFCRGPHVPATGRVKAFKLMSLAGAYWLGDENNPQLQRLYGTAFFSSKEMEQHFARLEEAQRRDHRVLGKQLDLFSIQELAGAGLIFWHPKGAMIRMIMEGWMRDECLKRGYELVYTPHVARVNLWQTSGHEGFYAQNMFTPMELDDADYRIKPMNCPFHILIYKNAPKSYRDLPVRYAELGNVYRYERSGTMHGLLRVRGFTQDDAHIFCSPSQIEDEVVACIEFAQVVLSTFGFTEFKVELSTWDPKDRKSYAGSDENWAMAIDSLEKALARKAIPHKTIRGEAAFYGPKIDIKLVDVLGRCGSFRPCSSTSTCRRVLSWSTWGKTASVINRSWFTGLSLARSSAFSACWWSSTRVPFHSGLRRCRRALCRSASVIRRTRIRYKQRYRTLVCVWPSITATRKWAPRFATTPCRNCPTYSSWATRKRSRARSACGSAARAIRAVCRSKLSSLEPVGWSIASRPACNGK